MKTYRHSERGVVLVLIVLFLVWAFDLAHGAPPAVPAQAAPQSLAEELRAADLEYRGRLEDILRRAEMQDDKAVKTDVERRQAATATYQSVGVPRVERTLTITGNLSGYVEFVMYPDSIGWSDWSHNEAASLVTLNSQVWTRWREEKMPVSVEQIVRWRLIGGSGKVIARYCPHAAGIRSIRLDAVGGNNSPFTLQIVYRAKSAQRN